MLNYTKTPIGVIVCSASFTDTGTNIDTTATHKASDLITGSAGYMVNGANVLYNIAGAGGFLTQTAANSGRFAWKDNTGSLRFSDYINATKLTTGNGSSTWATKTSPADPVAQVSYIGYNGATSTYAIDVYDSTRYELQIFIKNSSIMGAHLHNMYPKFAGYTSDSSATQAEIAIGLTDNLYKNFKDEPVMKIQADTLCNATVTAGNGWASNHDAVVVRGSNKITVGTNCQYATNTELAVGDYVRISAGISTGTALGNNVYKVVEINSTTVFTVDRPVTNASGTYAGSSDAMEVIPAATGNAANWGIRLVGVELFTSTYCTEVTNYWSLDGRMSYDVNSFTIVPYIGFGSTPITYTTAASRGVNTYWEVAELELLAQGFDGNIMMYGTYSNTINKSNASRASLTASTKGYISYTFSWYDDGYTSEATGLTVKQPKTLMVFVPAHDTTSTTTNMDAAF